VAIDLLRLGRRSLGTRSFAERRARLVDAVRPADWFAVSRGVIGEGTMFGDAAANLGFSAISARLLLAHYRGGPADDAWLRLPVAPVEPGRMSPFLAVFRALPL
jgi:ATP-dependent DNA ligase